MEKLTAQIAKVYMPCKITDKYANGVQYDMVGISEYEGNLQVKMPSGDTDWWNIDICQLILTPLSKITDEHAIEVALICKRDYHRHFVVSDIKSQYSETTEKGYNILWITFDSLSTNIAGHSDINKHKIGISSWGSVSHYFDGELSPVNMSREIIDYLRSKSYDCGHGSIPSLIAAGIAIDSTNE